MARLELRTRLESWPSPGLTRGQAALKRGLDLALALPLTLLALPVILLAALAARLDTGAGGFFMQTRIGRHGRPFTLIKIRTMRPSTRPGSCVTVADDPRITPLGRWLRRTKIDELPQLFNVLLGQMSFVGPRPDVPGYADRLLGDDRLLLTVRPGITGPASLKYRDEERWLVGQSDPERFNREVIYPDKVRLNCRYVMHWSLRADLVLIWRTLFPCG